MLRAIALSIAGIASVAAVVSARSRPSSPLEMAGVDGSTAPAVVTVTAHDYAYDAPDTIKAGVTTVRLVNRGTELHHIQIIRLDAGKTAQDLFGAMKGEGPLPAWAHAVGGPNASVPGGEANATLSLVPGNYVLLCLIPSPGGPPHVMKGMSKSIVVVPAPSRAAAPTPDVTATLSDYAFGFSRPLTAGHRVIRVTNAAQQAHEFVIAKLEPGKTPQDVLAWIDKPQGPPPGIPLGGVVGLDRGQSNTIELDLTPGEYALICFFPDAKDGKPHFMHGMMQQITVK